MSAIEKKIEAAEAAPDVPQVYAAIRRVMQSMARDGISKDRENQQQRYRFRGIDDVMNALSVPLSEAGLLFLPRVIDRQQVERQTKSGNALFYTTVTIEFDLISVDDGSRITIRTVGEAMDSADKSSNKAMSAAYKYAALQAFCIPTEGDNDADATTYDVAPRDNRNAPRNEHPREQQQERRAPTSREVAQRLITAVGKHETLDALNEWLGNPSVVSATNRLGNDDLAAVNRAINDAKDRLDPDFVPF